MPLYVPSRNRNNSTLISWKLEKNALTPKFAQLHQLLAEGVRQPGYWLQLPMTSTPHAHELTAVHQPDITPSNEATQNEYQT